MAFTKIAAAGIGSTETVTLHSLEVLNNATVGGVLTYEDVTNVDSIGIITARAGVLVGSGITLSKDGDIFATGVTTATKFVGDGSELTGVASTENIRTNTNATFLQNINVSGTSTVGGEANFASNLSIGGNISIPDKIIHTDDTNTSIRFPAVDKVTVETSGTERLAIEPAGNVNAPKSVVVGTGLTVGSATSTSTFIGQGSLELTRSDGSAHIDFKNAFADDYDARIITSGGNQLQFFTGGQGSTLCALQTATAKVAIATDVSPSIAKFEVHSDKLGGTAGNTQELLLVKSPDITNSTTYRFTNYRKSNGTTHVTSELRFRRHVDATDMGYFGLGDGYSSIGYATGESFRVTSGGNTLVGGTSAYATFENSSTNPRLQVRGTNLNGSSQAWIRATADGGGPKLFLANSRSTAEAGHTVVQAGDELGQVHFTGSDGSQFVNGASIAGVVRAGTTPASDNVPGDLTFAVNHGSTGTTEAVRISRGGNGGRFMLNHTDTGSYNANFSVREASSGPYPIGAIGQTSSQGLVGFFAGNGSLIGSIGKSGSSVTYNTSSDYRLKENAVSISDGITRLKSLKPYKFNFIDDSSTTLDGFFAHEVSSVVPEAVTGDKDGIITQEYIDEGKELQGHLGKPIIQSLDHSKLVPLLTAALQEAITKIETLETKVAALEG